MERVFYTILIYVHEGEEATFRAYEDRAMPYLGRHGGRVELMMTPERTSAGLELPHEMHVLSFANERGWVNYRGDPQVMALAPLRDKSVSKAIFLKGTRLPLPERY